MNKTHKLAQGLASLGRGPDEVLIHMSRRELRGLDSLAKASGTALTLNPKTGLPEAGVLDSILPMIAGIAVTAMTGGTALAAYGPLLAALGGAGTKAAVTGKTDVGTLASGALGGYGGAGLGSAIGKLGAAAPAAAGAPVGTGTVLAPATAGQNMMTGAKVLADAPMKGLASLGSNLTTGHKVGLGATALDAMSSMGNSGKYKKDKPTWYMYGDANTPGFDPNTQRYGPAVTTQDPKTIENYLLSQSAMQPPPPPPVKAAGGGSISRPVSLADYYAEGGDVGGRHIQGPGDGVSDSIPAMIDGQQPAALGRDEFVIDARTVSEIGNGSSAAGAEKLYAMMDRIHQARKKASIGEDSGAAEMLPA